jgi:hypothetical protein
MIVVARAAFLLQQSTNSLSLLASRTIMTTSSASTGKKIFHSPNLPLHFPKDKIDLTLIQLGQTSSDKGKNIQHALKTIKSTIKPTPQGQQNTQIVVLPECWNSPYGVQYFDTYAEDFGGLWTKIKSAPGADRISSAATFDAEQEEKVAN